MRIRFPRRHPPPVKPRAPCPRSNRRHHHHHRKGPPPTCAAPRAAARTAHRTCACYRCGKPSGRNAPPPPPPSPRANLAALPLFASLSLSPRAPPPKGVERVEKKISEGARGEGAGCGGIWSAPAKAPRTRNVVVRRFPFACLPPGPRRLLLLLLLALFPFPLLLLLLD
ncbi:hypothetical protein DAI22_03g305000 [Oryza sativa Japonica Group]|nr:hypothetical protein DAI22_03g305000 [Oryza sativa Japonica Group]